MAEMEVLAAFDRGLERELTPKLKPFINRRSFCLFFFPPEPGNEK